MLSLALSQLENLTSLKLEFNFNNIGLEGAVSLSSALCLLKNLNYLQLELKENNIGDIGA